MHELPWIMILGSRVMQFANDFHSWRSHDGWCISCKIALRWMPLDLTGDKSTLVQVMAWCRQATSHYLNQCWPRSLSPYGVTRPQWVKLNSSLPSDTIQHVLINTALGNGLVPVRHPAITQTNVESLSDFREIQIKIQFWSKKMPSKMLSAKRQSFCWGLCWYWA